VHQLVERQRARSWRRRSTSAPAATPPAPASSLSSRSEKKTTKLRSPQTSPMASKARVGSVSPVARSPSSASNTSRICPCRVDGGKKARGSVSKAISPAASRCWPTR